MNRLRNIMDSYLTTGDILFDKDSVEAKVTNFIDEVRKDKEVHNELLTIICEDFNVKIENDRLLMAIGIFANPLSSLLDILEETIKNNEHVIKPFLDKVIEGKNLSNDIGLNKALYPDNMINERKYLYGFNTLIYALIDDFVREDESDLPFFYPTKFIDQTVMWTDSIITTLKRGIDDEDDAGILYELSNTFKDNVFRNKYKDTWLEIK